MKTIFCALFAITSVCISHAQFLSSKSFGDTTTNFWMKMTETTDGGFIAYGNMHYKDYPQQMNAVVVKFNISGDTVWTRLFTDTISTQYSIKFFAAVESPDSADYLIFGHYDTSGIIIKMDTTGQVIFVKKYGSTFGSMISFEHASIINDSIFITGRKNTGQTNPVLLIKTDLEGNIVWAKQDTNYVQGVYQQITDGQVIYLAGYRGASNGFENPQVKKVDSQGNIIWTTIYNVVNGNHMSWWGNVDIAPDGNLLLTYMNGDYWMSWIYPSITKIDTLGNPIWTQFFIWENGFASTFAMEDGNLLMLQTPNHDIWSKITFLNTLGDPQVTYADTGSLPEYPDPTSRARAYLKLNTAGRKILFTDPFFLVDSVSGIPCEWFIHNTAMVDSGGHSYSHPIEQSFPVTLYSDTGSVVVQSGITMQVICPVVTNYNDNYNEESFYFAPNPARQHVNIRTKHTGAAQVELFNIAGAQIRVMKIIGNNTFMDISDIPRGVYYLKFASAQMAAVKKLIVQ